MNKQDNVICRLQELESVDYLTRPVWYHDTAQSLIVFLHEGKVYAYINHCIHQQRRLDCQADTVFDRSGQFLHCSMHGCTFEPTTGECISPVCAGEKLMSVKVIRDGQNIVIKDPSVHMNEIVTH